MNIVMLSRKEIRQVEAQIECISGLVGDISEAHIDGDYVGVAHEVLEMIINECRRQQMELEGAEEAR